MPELPSRAWIMVELGDKNRGRGHYIAVIRVGRDDENLHWKGAAEVMEVDREEFTLEYEANGIG